VRWASVSARGLVEDAYQVRLQEDQPVVLVEAHVQPVSVPADDLAVLVQSGGHCPVLLVYRDLLDAAQERNGGAIDVTPLVGWWVAGVERAWWTSRGAGVGMVAVVGWPR
jgi:hypothetical protein